MAITVGQYRNERVRRSARSPERVGDSESFARESLSWLPRDLPVGRERAGIALRVGWMSRRSSPFVRNSPGSHR
jgi:hypothetical protein